RKPMRPFALAAVLAVLATSGCLKEKTTITVYPDGSGKIEVSETLGHELADLQLMMADTDEKKAEAAEKSILKKLASWEGVSAWTGFAAKVKKLDEKKNEIHGVATGFFEDVTKLRLTEEKSQHDFKWTKNADGGFTVEEVVTD